MNRGDVVILQFPYVDGRRGKNRPAVVVQNDRDNGRLTNTVVAMITGNTQSAGEATQLLIDPATPEGASTALRGLSAVKCNNLFTVAQQDVLRVIGRLSANHMTELDLCLKAALDLT